MNHRFTQIAAKGHDCERSRRSMDSGVLAAGAYRRLVSSLVLLVTVAGHLACATVDHHQAQIQYSSGTRARMIELYEQGRFREALAIAEALSRAVLGELAPDDPKRGAVQATLAEMYASTGDYRRAEPLYFAALALQERVLGPYKDETLTTLEGLSGMYRAAGRFDSAAAVYQRHGEVNPFDDKTIEMWEVPRYFDDLATAYWAAGRRAEAWKAMGVAIDADDRVMRVERFILPAASRERTFRGVQARTSHVLAHQLTTAANDPVLVELAVTKLLQRKGWSAETDLEVVNSFNSADPSNRSRETLWRLLGADGKLTEFLERLRISIDGVSDVNGQLATLALLDVRGQGRPGDDDEAAKLRERRDALERDIGKDSYVFRTFDKELVTLKQVQAAIPKTAALIEFTKYPTFDATSMEGWVGMRYGAYLILPDAPPMVLDLGNARRIDALCLQLRAALSNTENAQLARDIGRALDELIMRPIRVALGDRSSFLLSPDGNLSLVPFSVLRDESGRYLLERYEFTYLNAGRDLLRLANIVPSDNRAAVYGSPRVADERVGRGAELVARLKLDEASDTSNEAEEIGALLEGSALNQGTAATKMSLRDFRRPRVLHIATHGFFLRDPENVRILPDIQETGARDVSTTDPMYLSGLLFADGVLTASEAAGLDLLGTELVTLSACETGVGAVPDGSGVLGLRRAFAVAGAKSVLMSLWKIDDEATRDLMVALYGRLRNGQRKGAALRAVQLSMMRQGRSAHFWSGFILSGDNGSLRWSRFPEIGGADQDAKPTLRQ
jgi:CHAT domain-containing protein